VECLWKLFEIVVDLKLGDQASGRYVGRCDEAVAAISVWALDW
jgi:hypothetical protein